jgi:hypothetical protein
MSSYRRKPNQCGGERTERTEHYARNARDYHDASGQLELPLNILRLFEEVRLARLDEKTAGCSCANKLARSLHSWLSTVEI